MDSFTLTPLTVSLIFLLLIFAILGFIYGKINSVKTFKNRGVIPTTNQDVPLSYPPGPTPLPIIGNLLDLSKYKDNPYLGFSILAQKYGPVYQMRMGSYPCLVVNDFENIKEILVKKADAFDQRPNFDRWNIYFGGDKNQSLALCDWSDLQNARRKTLRSFLILKQNSLEFSRLDSCLGSEMDNILAEIEKTEGKPCLAKKPIAFCALNVFLRYMCSLRFDYTHKGFVNVTKAFDSIFEDINNGHPTDFLPWLSPFYASYKRALGKMVETVRDFILTEVIKDRMEIFDPQNTKDLLEALLATNSKPKDDEVQFEYETILFALEDLLGGSSAITNIVMRTLTYLAQNKHIQEKYQQEIDEKVGKNRYPNISDRNAMVYAEATILETLRHTNSPIVPHVAGEDTTVGEFFVKKGTVVFLNNYPLNKSPSLWKNPSAFLPERFIQNGQLRKPAHFIPFSTGKRACIGSVIMKNVTFVTVSTLLQKYSIRIPEGEEVVMPECKLSLVGDGFNLIFEPRS